MLEKYRKYGELEMNRIYKLVLRQVIELYQQIDQYEEHYHKGTVEVG